MAPIKLKEREVIESDKNIITKGKLILIPYVGDGSFIAFYGKGNSPKSPVIISESAEIGDGDYYLGKGKSTIDNSSIEWCHKHKYSKVLAFPEQFSSESLKDIINRKFKDGEEVIIECDHNLKHTEELIADFKVRGNYYTPYTVKLNSKNHVIIHKI